MLAEPRDLPADAVLAAVRSGWDPAVSWVEYAPIGAASHHWWAGTPSGARWFVTCDPLPVAEEHAHRRATYGAAAELSAVLDFALAPVPGRHGETTRSLPPSYLLSVAPYVEGIAVADPVTGGFADDAARCEVAAMLARLHNTRRPAGIGSWCPRIGWRASARRERLDRARGAAMWDAGPLGAPAWRVVTGAAPLLDRALRRFDLLAAAASGTASAWVPTHGEPHAGKVLATAGGLRLGDWAGLAVAPPERDLRHLLLDADGEDPELAYLASGGAPRARSEDLLELFALERHLAAVAASVARLAGAHPGTLDDERCLEELDAELAALRDLAAGWG